jgi:hypothetical protein
MKRPTLIALAALGLLGLTLPEWLLAEEESKKGERISKKEMRQAKRKAKGRVDRSETDEKELKPIVVAPFSTVKNPAPVARNRKLTLSRQQVQQQSARIDSEIAAKLAADGKKRNASSSDEIFVRRIYLDAVGRIPTPTEVKGFMEDDNSNKRATLIDRLLVSEGYVSHQFNWYADMLRLKSTIKRAKYDLYVRWLKDGIRSNRPWDKTVHAMLAADGSTATNGATGYLLRDTGMPLDSLSNTLTTFLGANISCAQCHDHPLADWSQREFYEMASFFGATNVSYRDPRKVGNRIKGPDGLTKQDGIAVFSPSMHRIKDTETNRLVYPKDYGYDDAKPGEKVVPRLIFWNFSDRDLASYQVDVKTPHTLRDSLASWMTHKDNPRFAANIANRVWKQSFGIAVHEPIYDIDNLQEGSNPKLLADLTQLMVDLKFDLREFQRVVFNTKTYQAEANPTPAIGGIGEYHFAGPVLRRMTAEQAWDSILILALGTKIDQFQVDKSHQTTRFALDFDAMVSSTKSLQSTALAFKKAGYINGKKKKQLSDMDLAGSGNQPQKFGRSYMLRASELPQPEQDRHFLRMFGQSSREIANDGSREGSIPQTLMLMNGEFKKLLTAPQSQLMRAVRATDSHLRSLEEVYLSFYSRLPTVEEQKLLQAKLKQGLTIQDLAWTLFNTPEFLFVQ